MTQPASFTTTLGGQSVTVNGDLKFFALKKQPSSLVDYFGMNYVENRLFIQFLPGTGTLYLNVPKEVLDMADEAPSIGKFFHAFIKGKYEFRELGNRPIRIADEEEDEDWDADEDLFPEGIED